MRVARLIAQFIGWLFVADLGYHAVLAVKKAGHAGSHSNWSYAVEMGAIALVAAALVIGAVITAARSRVRRR